MAWVQSSLKSSGGRRGPGALRYVGRPSGSWHELTFRMMTDKDLPELVDGLRSILTDKTSWVRCLT